MISVCFLLLCLPSYAFAGMPAFVQLQSDAQSYIVGEQAVLTAFIQTTPQDSDYELFVQGSLSGSALQIIPIADDQQVSVSPYFSAVGPSNWVVSVYLQDKRAAGNYTAAIAFYQAEVVTLTACLAKATDPNIIASLQAQIARDQNLISMAGNELTLIRKLVETDTLTFNVTQTRKSHSAEPSAMDNVFSLSLDQSSGIYHVGQNAFATAQVLTSFTGEDGPEEAVVTAFLDSKSLGQNVFGPTTFSFTTANFLSADIGTHSLTANLLIRSQARANSLRNSIQLATTRRNHYMALRDATTDPAYQALYQRYINDLILVINELYTQLQQILSPITSATAAVQVLQ